MGVFKKQISHKKQKSHKNLSKLKFFSRK